MHPIKLSPAFKDYLWGGTKLKTSFGKKSDLDIVAESWELSTHKDGQSVVALGEDRGLTLSEYIDKYGRDILGKNAQKFDYFPILIKLIDAKGSLSIQVHPDDAYALEHEGEYGKTEMWYILDAEEGASLYYGVQKSLTKKEFERRIKNNTLLKVLNKVDVHKGDVFFIEAGTIHAIGEGIVICEIQQNSNTTYRVYDYDRRDANGNARELHIEKAIEVSTLDPITVDRSGGQEAVQKDGYTDQVLAACPYFTVEKLGIEGQACLTVTDQSFQSLMVTEGRGVMHFEDTALKFMKGDSLFIPAQNSKYSITGDCEIILSYV